MIEFKNLDDGHEFYNNGELVAIGVMEQGIYSLTEIDDTFSEHANAMGAIGFLNKKYYASLYQKVSRFEYLLTEPAPDTSNIGRFKKHGLLQGVSMYG